MCGVVGVFGSKAKAIGTNLGCAVQSLSHRGPDDGGIWVSGDDLCFLGHRRLSILDSSSAASQPMINERFALAYNGEIYNHKALREKYLSQKKINFKTHSDTETLFYLLQHYSPLFILDKLRGMFAGVFYDSNQKQLLLFRDSLGIKPLYYHNFEDGTIAFSSEIRGLNSLLPRLLQQVDKHTLDTYLTFENWCQGKTLYNDVHLLCPGEVMTVKWDGHSFHSKNEFFSICETASKDRVPQKSYEEWVKYVRNAVEETVETHLLSDVPLSAYLSGGLDSGTIVTLASRHQKDFLAFTGYFEVDDEWYDEREYARKTAQLEKIEHLEIPIKPQAFVEHFDDLINVIEEPRMGMGSFSQYIVAKAVAERRRVILAGHGGDELFLGYPNVKACMALKHFPQSDFWKTVLSLHGKEWPWLLNIMAEYLRGDIYLAPRLWNRFPYNESGRSTLNILNEFKATSAYQSFEDLMTYYQQIYLPGLLMVEDKVSMSFGLETRTPFWDRDFIHAIKKIPNDIKLSKGRLKGLFKDAVSCWLPPEVIHAPKKGFPTPFRYWFRNELRAEIEKRLLKEGDALDPLINKKQRQQLLRSHFNIKLPFALDEKRAHRIWMLLCLESWSRQKNIDWRSS